MSYDYLVRCLTAPIVLLLYIHHHISLMARLAPLLAVNDGALKIRVKINVRAHKYVGQSQTRPHITSLMVLKFNTSQNSYSPECLECKLGTPFLKTTKVVVYQSTTPPSLCECDKITSWGVPWESPLRGWPLQLTQSIISIAVYYCAS